VRDKRFTGEEADRNVYKAVVDATANRRCERRRESRAEEEEGQEERKRAIELNPGKASLWKPL
jgi:nucleosome binding factor SPN SPT16 subunit